MTKLFGGDTVATTAARTTTSHGFPILQRKPAQRAGCEIVAVFAGPEYAQPFVVWRMDARGNCEGGDYCADLASLGAAFAEREAAPPAARKARLLVTISEGVVDTVAVEGLDDVEIELVKIDHDTDGADEADGCLRVEGDLMWVSVGEVERMTPDDAHLARTAYDTWAMT